MSTEEMIRYKATIAYDGTNFYGFQIQPQQRTVQGEIEETLQKIVKHPSVRIHGAGRTDAGVHADQMVFHFDFPSSIPEDGVFKAMNVLFPEDIVLRKLERAPAGFHARHDAIAKTYSYRLDNSMIRNPFNRHLALHHPYEMNERRARQALKYLEGTHDFTSFCSAKTLIENKVRTIYKISVEVDEKTNEWLFRFTGDGFLYNMIRIIMGTVIEMADGRREVSQMPGILRAHNRNKAGKTIAAKGLRLEKVYYSEQDLQLQLNSEKTTTHYEK